MGSPDTNAALTARERFSEASTGIWLQATAECRRLGQFYVGVEHLFLAIALRQPALLQRALGRSSVSQEAVMAAVRQALGIGPEPDWERIRVTPRTRRVLGLADRLSHEACGAVIEPIHLLSAILLEGESLPARAMMNLGIDLPAAADTLMHCLTRARRGSATPCLDRFGRDLVELANQGAFDPLVGRERELELLMEVLCRRTKNNPVLLGEAGVGKTAIVEGLAQRIAADQVPPPLRGMRLVQVSASRLLSGSGSQAEEQVRQLIYEARGAENVTLFVDEMHALAGGPGTDAAALLKMPLARGELRCVGATTTAEYRRFIEGEPALERRFQPILVAEPTRAMTLEILHGLRDRYERHHGVTISEEALQACVVLSTQYLRDRQQPDKAIDLMDQSAARVAIRASGSEVLRTGPAPGHDGVCSLPGVVSAPDVAGVVSDLIGMEIPAGGSDPGRLRQLEAFLAARVLGQEEAVAAVAQVIRVAKRELDLRPTRPDGVILLVGSTGVGKTLLARSVCEFLHGEDEDSLIRLDMSEYSEPHTLARLVGSPPGYVGYEEEGQLTGRVRSHPDCVLLLDEIDRAHPSVRALFLQVFDEGRLSDSRGRCVHFDHVTLIMTTTAGAAGETAAVGFLRGSTTEAQDRMMAALSDQLSGDFLSRIDRIVPLKALSRETVEQIAGKMLFQVRERLQSEGKELIVEAGVQEIVAAYHYNPRQGARHLAHAVDVLVIEPLATLAYDPGWDRAAGVRLAAVGGHVELALIGKA